jgi:hypothetical protein
MRLSKRKKKTAQNWIFYFFSDRDVNKKRLSSLLRQPLFKELNHTKILESIAEL